MDSSTQTNSVGENSNVENEPNEQVETLKPTEPMVTSIILDESKMTLPEVKEIQTSVEEVETPNLKWKKNH